MIEIATAINGFPVPQSDQPAVILVPLQVLQELLAEVQSLRVDVQDLKARQEAIEEQIASREVQLPGQEGIVALGAILRARDEDINALKAEMVALEESTARERAYDRQRLASLEHREPTPSEKTLEHVDELYNLMRKEGHPPLSVARAARLLGMSKSGLKNVMPLIRQDQRFEIVRDPQHKQRFLIRLRKFAGR